MEPVVCTLCPHHCALKEGQLGFCRARTNAGGRITPLAYGHPCSVALDPMEKKPLFHFHPGEAILSLGTGGCNLHCRNCQNASISQVSPLDLPMRTLPPEKLPSLMRANGTRHAAYTYNEPLVAYEYVLDCARAVKGSGGSNVLVSAAYIEKGPLAALLPFIDAANIDLKAYSDSFYRANCGASLAPVLEALRLMRRFPVSLEVTNLLIPTLNDSPEGIAALSRFVRDELGAETPLHFSRFFPRHKLSHLPETPEKAVTMAVEIARAEGLKHVYRGNSSMENDTCCASCGEHLIVRSRYAIVQNKLQNGRCPSCGAPLYGRF
ncbi:MAG: AmmeMemoRadiSam system radical SAM enzyme [Mailhella sp.]|nr:AmmeMemoRadiSam system radical SAM enzyme [Mailhella sp.]